MPQERRTTFQDAFEIFLLDAKSRRLSSRTIEFYQQRLGWFFDWLESADVHHLQSLTRNHIRAYLGSLADRELSGYTQHAMARAIKTFCFFCVGEEWIEVSPMKGVRMPRVDDAILSAFEPADVQRLLSATRYDRDKAIILCLLDTGCRASEFLGWTGGDVDTKQGTVKVKGKNRKERIVYMGAKALKALLRYFIERGKPSPVEPVWISLRGGRGLTYNGLRQMLTRLGDAAGVEKVSPHRFRRTFALWSLRNGMSIYELQRLMGHADIQVLRRYLALVENDLAQAHKRYGPADNMLGDD
ncbi:tyrosine-type recombinase/integrase [bacterium]|nr:tyrosine-type recombinase/integrase [bacterium]